MSCLSTVLENLKDLNILAGSFLVLPTVTCVTNMYVNTPLQKTSEKYGIFPLAKICCASSRPFFRSSVLLFCHSAVLPFCRSAGLPFCRSAVLPFCRSVVLSFCRSHALQFCNTRQKFSPHISVMRWRMMLRKIICQIRLTGPPINFKLALLLPIE